MVSSWHRAAPNTIPTAAKAGGNYLSSLLVGSEARRHGYQEGIALDVHGYVSEGAGENLFMVKNGGDLHAAVYLRCPAGDHP
ncbi:aminotransferase class IV [Edwardsiella ictaluri]|nr:aminotransferase class IV [Edwardsiella ictaluri]WFO13988.1 aminotransferase class IV [Edwardsiella ictaluri]